MHNRPAVVRAIEIICAPDALDTSSVSILTLTKLLTAVARNHLKDDCDFLKFDATTKSLSTQSFIDFNKDAIFKMIRITDPLSSFGNIYSIIEDEFSTINYNSLASI